MGWDAEKLAHWAAHYKNWQASGLTQKIYCEREALVQSSFERWAKRVRSNTKAQADQKSAPVVGASKPLTLVPVRMIDQVQPEPITLHSPSGWQLTMPATIDSQWLAAFMRSMA
jgi:hypothetical protein